MSPRCLNVFFDPALAGYIPSPHTAWSIRRFLIKNRPPHPTPTPSPPVPLRAVNVEYLLNLTTKGKEERAKKLRAYQGFYLKMTHLSRTHCRSEYGSTTLKRSKILFEKCMERPSTTCGFRVDFSHPKQNGRAHGISVLVNISIY